MKYDVVIVGAGPAGLAAAIRLMQLAENTDYEISVCVLEKGSQVGSHILSGAVLDPKALNELIPDWQNKKAPLDIPVSKESLLLLSESRAYRMPVPPSMNNHGNYVVSLGKFCVWLAEQAEEFGVEIYPNFSAAEVLFNSNGAVKGVATGEMGRQKDGTEGPNFEEGVELHGKYTFFAEGCRGHLGKILMEKFQLREQCDSQAYAIGLKELWEVNSEHHSSGSIAHSIGWPLPPDTYGGSFTYHMENNLVALGLIVGLDYPNPHLSPYDEFQRFKTHPHVRTLLNNGRRIFYGARAINEGGLQSLPKLAFPGGCLIGCEAGFVNNAKMKGIHTAMKSGMLAAEATFEAITSDQVSTITGYEYLLRNSWLWKELHLSRNLRPSFAKWGLWGGLAYSAMDSLLFCGKAPWTMHHHATDNESTRLAKEMPILNYPKYDGLLTFDKLTNIAFSGVEHEENQPCHLKLSDSTIPVRVNLAKYAGLEALYCPADVYEFVTDDTGEKQLQINASNCIHCKTCDIKDPTQNITWVTPQGGEGPNYSNM